MINSTSSNEKTQDTKRWFSSRPFYILLLPLFFVLHGVRENFGFIFPADAASLLFMYLAGSVILYGIIYLFYRKPEKAGLLTILLLGIFFFFGVMQDFLKSHLSHLNRYIILLPFFLGIILITVIFLKRTNRSFVKTELFLNMLLVIVTVYDLAIIITNSLFPPKDKFTVYSFSQKTDFSVCPDCDRPDIYFLLFDEYASSKCLKDNFGYDNSQLDSFLTNKQFHIQKNSSGNYNFTPFSMASILNMSYINGITDSAVTVEDYARCNNLIRENEVIKFLSAYGYDIVNYSIFDLAGNPSPVFQDFLPLKTKLISSRTFWGRIKKDLLWNLFSGKFEVKWLTDNVVFFYLKNNELLVNLVKEESSKHSLKPRFIYAHYNMPHPPYYYDSTGKMKDKKVIEHDDDNKSSYLDNVKYTNGKIQELVNTIQTNTKGKAVILVMGDHGFRHDQQWPKSAFLENQNAVYLPDKNYTLFYDSITGVNQFRVLANTLFRQRIPLLKDSTFFLKDKMNGAGEVR